ncbi:MAG: sodium-dependent bicarbonate transport family permease [Tepidimonas sp.]|uniref:sodium-dependent bicarbonate transport family permease n=1 Tax=Tepidimonas sp. TaxID=2002775 RepID=UPI00405524EF
MQSLLDPAILFFILGMVAGAVRSNLEIPPPIAKFLSLYLLMALGLKGGFALAQAGLRPEILVDIGAAMAMAVAVPLMGYALLRRHVSRFDAAAVGACYGSVSAVTFVTAAQFLTSVGLTPGGHMTVAMVMMESPAIIVAVLLANAIRKERAAQGAPPNLRVGHILHESFTDGSQVLLLGALLIGYLSGETGKAVMQPFSGDLFKGMLAFFLLDMGLVVARNFQDARKASAVLLAYAAVAPVVHAGIALGLAAMLAMPVGNAVLLMVLSASASYIVVPAALRYAIPEANPALYLGLSLGVTFPLNILLGIPLYTEAARAVLG